MFISISNFCYNAFHFSTFSHLSCLFLLFFLDSVLSQYSSLNLEITYSKFQFIFVFVIIYQFISLIIWIKSTKYSSALSLISTLHKSITTMDSNDKMDDIGRNLMHKNDAIRIRENSKVAQHYLDFKDTDLGHEKEHLEAHHCHILLVNVSKNNACFCQRKHVLAGHTNTRSWPRSPFATFDSNCPKQRMIFNRCDQVDLKTLERGQELYTDPHIININRILLIGRLMCIVTPGKKEKKYIHIL